MGETEDLLMKDEAENIKAKLELLPEDKIEKSLKEQADENNKSNLELLHDSKTDNSSMKQVSEKEEKVSFISKFLDINEDNDSEAKVGLEDQDKVTEKFSHKDEEVDLEANTELLQDMKTE